MLEECARGSWENGQRVFLSPGRVGEMRVGGCRRGPGPRRAAGGGGGNGSGYFLVRGSESGSGWMSGSVVQLLLARRQGL